MKRFTIVTSNREDSAGISLAESVTLTGLHPQMIRQFVEAGFVRAVSRDSSGDPRFDARGLLRLRRIEELQTRQRSTLRTIRYVAELLDRLEAAEQELIRLRERLR